MADSVVIDAVAEHPAKEDFGGLLPLALAGELARTNDKDTHPSETAAI